MRILIYGLCDDYGSGAWCYRETLKDMGHEVRSFSPNQGIEKYYRSAPYRIARRILGQIPERSREMHTRALQAEAATFCPEILIVLNGLLLDRRIIMGIRAEGTWTALINHDDFFSSLRSNRSSHLSGAIAHYDFVFPTKEVNVVELRDTAMHIEFFPFAYYPRIHRPPVPNEIERREWQSDVVFIGNCYPERTRQLEHLVRSARVDLKIYGPNWDRLPRRSPLSGFIQGRSLAPEDMANAIFFSKVSIGFLCKENRDDYTQRTFEIPACKGVLLAERTTRHMHLYREGSEAEFFNSSDYDELALKTKRLLGSEAHRECLRQAGYEAVLRGHHTYQDRLTRLLALHAIARRKDSRLC